MGHIPDGSVAAGCPAKVICSLEEYHNRRKEKCIEESLDYAKSIKERFGREPMPSDFWEEFPLFVSGKNIEKYEKEIPIRKQLGNAFDYWIVNHEPYFEDFEDFIKASYKK